MQRRFWVQPLILAGLALTLTGCLKQSSTPTSSTSPTTTPSSPTAANDLTALAPTTFDVDLNAHLSQATAAAKLWKADAVVSYVSVEPPTSLVPNLANEVYVFGSASDLDNWFTYSYAEATEKFVRAIIPKTDYLGSSINPIDTSFWKMNYVEAFQLAEKNGGSTFRQSNPNTKVTMFLSQRAPRGWLWWSIQYTPLSGQALTLLVNPFRGEVVDETGKQLAPAKGTTPTPTPSTVPTT